MTCKTDECAKIFVTWIWLAGVVCAIAATVGSLSWAGSSKITTVDIKIKSLESEIGQLKTMPSNIDTIKTMLREGRR